VYALLLCLPLLLRVPLHAREKLVSAAGFANVLDANVDALLNVPVADLSVEDHAERGLGDVVYDTGLAVVDFVGLRDMSADTGNADVPTLAHDLTYHALLDRTICHHINDVADFVLLEVCGQRDHALLLEIAGEGYIHESACCLLCEPPYSGRVPSDGYYLFYISRSFPIATLELY